MPASEEKRKRNPALFRSPAPARERERSRLIAWDLETTRIRKGTPAPVYITGYSEFPDFCLSKRVESLADLFEILKERFLTSVYYGCKFVAWNANNFDSYFSAAALLLSNEFEMRPYLTRGKTLRGLKVFKRGAIEERNNEHWEFLDGIAMTGMQGVSLASFTEKFSPERQKKRDVIDFEKEEFNADRPEHREYAFEDSVSLYYAMVNAESILLERFNQNFGATMGGACIKIFKRNIPEGKVIYDAGESASEAIRSQVMRGGFCYCARKYKGPIWKFDLNQAYAAAMRETKLPAGGCYNAPSIHPLATVFIVRIRADNPSNAIPFYCKTTIKGRSTAIFAVHQIPDTWITSTEYFQLLREGWRIEVLDSYFWDDDFCMREFVDALEKARQSCNGGPSGPTGTMIKMVGNHSYGKTVEQLDPLELVLAKECPEGFSEFLPEAVDNSRDAIFLHVWQRDKEITPRDYHKPQIGAFITSHVRMVVRRAALLDPDSWIYADTDCAVFNRDVSALLDLHPSRYGAWKIESAGDEYRIIAKKVYSEIEFDADPKNSKAIRHAKGLNVKYLTPQDFETWFQGTPPKQKQVHRNNFVKVMQGQDMYTDRERRGTAV